VAARQLVGRGFQEVYDLKGGIQAWNHRKAIGPQELNMDMLRGDESPTEIVMIAYGMEQALGGFYTTLSQQTKDVQLKDLFSKLASIEQRHRKMLYALYAEINPSEKNVKHFEEQVDAKRMEGGFSSEDFIKQNEAQMKTVPDILAIAMMIETQALDLYLRYADRSSVGHTKEILYTIADEERAHLAALGRLMGEKA
jgi:rubrerythrin